MSDVAEFEALDEYVEAIIAVLYSEPGQGKTSFGASHDNTLIIATEKGTIAASRVHKGKYKNVRVANCTGDFRKVEETVEKLENDRELCDSFEWLVVDTGTEMHRLIKKDIVVTRVGQGKNKNLDKIQLEEYGEQQMRFQRFWERINELGPNVLWLFHVETFDNVHGNPAVRPDVHGQKGALSAWTSAQGFVCGYLTTEMAETKSGGEKKVRKIQWSGDDSIRAKDRFDCLPEYTVDWTLTKLTDFIYDHAGQPE